MRKVSSGLFLLLLALAPALSHAQAAAHPDYSGTYVLDPAQSDQGQMTPTKLTMAIVQTPASIVVDRAQANAMGESTAKLTYALDGSTSKNQISAGGNMVDISTVVTWEGDSPVFTNAMKFGDQDVQSVDKWSLSDGGKKLTLNRTFNMGGQEMASKLVLNKQ
jgi:hypothetical protein